jgi:hypothetical protein
MSNADFANLRARVRREVAAPMLLQNGRAPRPVDA